jgi:hypothetical protein
LMNLWRGPPDGPPSEPIYTLPWHPLTCTQPPEQSRFLTGAKGLATFTF